MRVHRDIIILSVDRPNDRSSFDRRNGSLVIRQRRVVQIRIQTAAFHLLVVAKVRNQLLIRHLVAFVIIMQSFLFVTISLRIDARCVEQVKTLGFVLRSFHFGGLGAGLALERIFSNPVHVWRLLEVGEVALFDHVLIVKLDGTVLCDAEAQSLVRLVVDLIEFRLHLFESF